MSWITLAIVAYLILALVNLGDKLVLDKVLGSSKLYAFIISALGSLVIFLAPWFLDWPGTGLVILQILIGALFPFALLFMYEALKKGDASKVAVLIGGLIPVLTVFLSVVFLRENFSANQWWGLSFLVAGSLAMALIGGGRTIKQQVFNRQAVVYSVLAALFYAVFFIGTKYAYDRQEFISAFIWLRLGALLAVLIFLIRRKDRQEILGGLRRQEKKPKGQRRNLLIFGTQILGAAAFILQNYAISLGPVAIINALQGVQYVILLLLGWILTITLPKWFKENISRQIIWEKALAIILVSLGLYFITS